MKHWLAVAFLLTVAVTFSLTSMATKSATVDEVPHIAAGYSYLVTGDYRMNFEHPPLIKKLAAAPLLLLKPQLDLKEEWNARNEWIFGQRFLYKWNEPERLLFWARMPVVLLFAGLGLLVYGCARDFYGSTSGLIALSLYLFTPDLLAHGQLVTTDLGITLFLFAGVYFFYRALRHPGVANITCLALATGLAAVTKYSAAVLPLIIIPLALWHILSEKGAIQPVSPDQPPSARRQRTLLIARLSLITLAATWLIIWAAYSFRFSILPPEIQGTAALNWNILATGWFNRTIVLFKEYRLLPEAYLYGAGATLQMLSNRLPYFFGSINPDHWWYFYPVSFALKTPLPLLVLLIWEGGRCLRLRRYDPRTIFLLLPVLLYGLVAISSKVAIGNRHILPIYPFLIVWVSQIGADLKPFKLSIKTGLITALLLWQIIGTIRIAPHFLSYYNESVGGPRRGYFYIVDSNFDWGQDLIGLAGFRNKHLDEKLFVSYFGMADPAYYLKDVLYLQSYPAIVDVDYVDLADVPPGALVAISATKLMSRNLETSPRAKELVERLRAMPPYENIGYSILVYRMP